jgi:hypothetical protein
VAEEYCWAITQSERRSWCRRSVCSVLKFGFKLDFLLYLTLCILKSDLRKIRLSPYLPERNYWVSPEVSVLVTEASFVHHMEKEAACPLSVLENGDYVLEIWGFALVRKWSFQ